jgi:hypothetical protein
MDGFGIGGICRSECSYIYGVTCGSKTTIEANSSLRHRFPPPRGSPLNPNTEADAKCITSPLNGGPGCAPVTLLNHKHMSQTKSTNVISHIVFRRDSRAIILRTRQLGPSSLRGKSSMLSFGIQTFPMVGSLATSRGIRPVTVGDSASSPSVTTTAKHLGSLVLTRNLAPTVCCFFICTFVHTLNYVKLTCVPCSLLQVACAYSETSPCV